MDPKKIKRSLFISLFVVAISFGNFTRLTGTESIRAIHIVTLLTCGMAIGVFLVNLLMLIRNRKEK